MTDTQRLREIQERVEKAPLTADELATIRARDGEHRVLRLLATIEDRDRTIAALTREKAESVVTEAQVDAAVVALREPGDISAPTKLDQHRRQVRAALEAALSAGHA